MKRGLPAGGTGAVEAKASGMRKYKCEEEKQ